MESLDFLVWVTITTATSWHLAHYTGSGKFRGKQMAVVADDIIFVQLTVMLGFSTIALYVRIIKICYWRELLSYKRIPPSKHYNLETFSTTIQSIMPYGFVHDDPYNHKVGQSTGPELVYVLHEGYWFCKSWY